MTSYHYIMDRKEREYLIQQIGMGTIVKVVSADFGHKNGVCTYKITSTAIILVCDYETDRVITKLIARPGQLKRYYGQERVPSELLKIAYEHRMMNYNLR